MTPDEIKELRKKMDMSQEKFAHILGTTVGTINRWELGKFKPSKIYLRELKQLERGIGSYICRARKPKDT